MKTHTFALPDTPLVNSMFKLVADLKAHLPNLYLAGGALRDIVYGKPIKDFDFYFNFEDQLPNISYLSDVIFPKQFEYVFAKKTGDDYVDLGFSEIYNFKSLTDKPKLQLIYLGTKRITNLVSEFDFSFNQIWFDGHVVTISEAFLNTLDTREVTLVNPKVRDIDHFIMRLNSFEKKFPELDFKKVNSSKITQTKKAKPAGLKFYNPTHLVQMTDTAVTATMQVAWETAPLIQL